jgi:hypothetical protein
VRVLYAGIAGAGGEERERGGDGEGVLDQGVGHRGEGIAGDQELRSSNHAPETTRPASATETRMAP